MPTDAIKVEMWFRCFDDLRGFWERSYYRGLFPYGSALVDQSHANGLGGDTQRRPGPTAATSSPAGPAEDVIAPSEISWAR